MQPNVDVVAKRIAEIRITVGHFPQFCASEGRVEGTASSPTPSAALAATPTGISRTEPEFERSESFRRRFHLIRPCLALRRVEHVRRTAMRVNRNVLPDGSTEQPVNRKPSDLSGEIPECDVDATHRRDVRHERILCSSHHVKVPLDRQWILTD